MPRANRFFVPGTVWHIAHRCHDRKFLLKFDKDRRRWKYWLFQSRKRYGLSILNYIATSNHIHLLVVAHIKSLLGIRAYHRNVESVSGESCVLKEGSA